jgi:translation elongation factor EF-1alpha
MKADPGTLSLSALIDHVERIREELLTIQRGLETVQTHSTYTAPIDRPGKQQAKAKTVQRLSHTK